jgi:hypothetical protein
MPRLFGRRRLERPCPLCARPVAWDAERCSSCGRRFKAMSQPLALPSATGLEISEAALTGLARRQ